MGKKIVSGKFAGREMARSSKVYIAGDVSATNISIEAFERNSRGIVSTIGQFSYNGQEVSDFKVEVFNDILEKTGLSEDRIENMVLAPAGPVSLDGKICEMTNAPFSLNTDLYECPIALINDFRAVSLGVAGHLMGQGEVKMIQLKHALGRECMAVEHGNIGIHGAGTGLGCGRLFWDSDRYRSLASEGGHRLLSINPRNKEDCNIYNYISQMYFRGAMLHCEAVLSGKGTERIFEYLFSESVSEGKGLEGYQAREFGGFLDRAEGISRMAKKYPNSVFSRVDRFFYNKYGRALHDLALHENATGGVYMAGGIIRKNIETSPGSGNVDGRISESIMDEFDSGPSHRDILARIPVYAILDKEVGLKGARYVCLDKREFEETRGR